MREALLEVGKRRKAAIGKGRRIMIAIETGKGTETGREVRIGMVKRTVTVITEIVVGIGVIGEIVEEIGMVTISTEIETMTGSLTNHFKLL